MKKSLSSLLILSLTAIVTVGFASPPATPRDNQKTALQHLSGRYIDPKGVDWGRGTYGTRVFTFDQGTWTLTFTLALDPAMQQPVFVFRTVGTYTVGEKSPTVAGAYHALFTERQKFVTLKTADQKLAQGFGLAACGFTKDVEQDISARGCALWKPVAECGADYDLLALGPKGQLYFGLRPPDNDLCTAARRPTKLNVPVVKVP